MPNLLKTWIYNHFCIKGCLGAQYEVFADAMIPIPSVCNLLKAKINTLFHYYHSIKLFHYMFLNEQDYPLNSIFRDMLIELGYEEYKNYYLHHKRNNYKYCHYLDKVRLCLEFILNLNSSIFDANVPCPASFVICVANSAR